MLVVLGFAMIAVFLYLVMAKRTTPIVALILVPIAFGLFAGAGLGISDMVVESLLKLAPTAGLLFFAIIFFGTMIDTGLFDPLIRLILKFVGNHPTRLVVGTALLTSIVSLDGDGSTTFIIVTSAFLPLYLRLRMRPVVLTVIAAMSNGVLNTVPWGGSTARAAAALNVSPIDIFVPMIPSIATGLIVVMLLAVLLGRSETRRLGRLELDEETSALQFRTVPAPADALVGSGAGGGHDDRGATAAAGQVLPAASSGGDDDQPWVARPHARPRLTWFNLVLTLAVMTVLVLDFVEPVVVFMVATGIALVINFPRISQQADQIKAHASSVVSVVGMVFAASVLTGVLSGTGMVEAMAQWLVGIIPPALGPYMAGIAGVLSIPLTFVMTNDAFYFGVLPILSETASHYGIAPVEMARASLVGQALHQSSPLVASFLLLIGLANVNLGDHFKKVIWRGLITAVAMLAVGGFFAYPLL